MNDVIIQAVIKAHCERSNWFLPTALVCLEQNSLSWYCQVSSRSTTMAFYDKLSIFLGDSQGNTQMLHVSRNAIVVDLELTCQYPLRKQKYADKVLPVCSLSVHCVLIKLWTFVLASWLCVMSCTSVAPCSGSPHDGEAATMLNCCCFWKVLWDSSYWYGFSRDVTYSTWYEFLHNL